MDDGVIDAAEVKELEDVLYADGSIDTEEAEFLFELNDAVSGKANDASWNALFVRAICDYLLCDEKTIGVIDDDEAAWLVTKIGADGQVDGVEKELLSAIKSKAKSFPASLDALLK
ncbi:MAG: TerB family tellurite resistance protein [Bacteroidia bacterium]|nr:TerB family tellurite resistance protein [Bacteroidia bacterium]